MNREISVWLLLTLAFSLLFSSPELLAAGPSSVSVREQSMVIPTYETGPPGAESDVLLRTRFPRR